MKSAAATRLMLAPALVHRPPRCYKARSSSSGEGILIARMHIRAAFVGAALVATLTVVAAAAGSTAGQKRMAAPDASRLGAIGPRFHDTVLSGPVRTLASAHARLSDFWGGPITASNGETLTIYVSNAYAQDETMRQNWAEFLV